MRCNIVSGDEDHFSCGSVHGVFACVRDGPCTLCRVDSRYRR